MINCARNTYLVKTENLKANNLPLNAQDYMNVGYMIGRYGINLSNNPCEKNPMTIVPQGVVANINSCTSKVFEDELNSYGINFDRII